MRLRFSLPICFYAATLARAHLTAQPVRQHVDLATHLPEILVVGLRFLERVEPRTALLDMARAADQTWP